MQDAFAKLPRVHATTVPRPAPPQHARSQSWHSDSSSARPCRHACAQARRRAPDVGHAEVLCQYAAQARELVVAAAGNATAGAHDVAQLWLWRARASRGSEQRRGAAVRTGQYREVGRRNKARVISCLAGGDWVPARCCAQAGWLAAADSTRRGRVGEGGGCGGARSGR
jgi:hypothetical protein